MTKTAQDIEMLPSAVAACALPMVLGLVATFAAWLACRHLHKSEGSMDISRWGVCFGAGFLGASTVHFMAAVLYVIIVIIVADAASARPSAFFSFLCVSTLIQLWLWIVITLPFTLLCSTIFWRVTKFPKGTDVLE